MTVGAGRVEPQLLGLRPDYVADSRRPCCSGVACGMVPRIQLGAPGPDQMHCTKQLHRRPNQSLLPEARLAPSPSAARGGLDGFYGMKARRGSGGKQPW